MGFGIAGDLAAAVLAGSSKISRLNPQEKSWLQKYFAGYFLPHEGYNFKLKTSSIPWLASKASLFYIFYRHAQEEKENMENSNKLPKRIGGTVITLEWKLQNAVILK